MNKKLTALLIGALIVISAIGIAGCSTSSQAKPLEDGVLNVGVEATFVPMEYKNDKNKLTGFDIEFGEALATQLSKDTGKNVKVEWTETAWDGIFNGLNAGQYDAVISCVSLTKERKDGYYMSTPYISNGIVIVSRTNGTQAKTAKDLDGKKVGVQIENTADYAAKAFKKTDAPKLELKQFDSMIECFTALEGGQIDYILCDEPVAEYYAGQKPDVYQVSSDILSNEPISVCIKKENTDFGKQVDTAIKAMQEDGTLSKLSEKWFKKDITKDIDADNLKSIQ